MPGELTVVYVAGAGRSGSTLLDTLLGQLDGFFSGGELGGVWGRGLVEGYLCGCGLPVRECSVWSAVFAAGAPGAAEAETIVRLQANLLRTRHLPKLLRTPSPSGWEPLGRYVDDVGALYRAIADATGATVVVDSSKRAAAAAVTAAVPGIRPVLVHLVRDPRAVAWSWLRHKDLPEGRGALPKRPVWHSTRSWISANALTEVVAGRHYRDRTLRLRYDDLVADPARAVAAIAALAGRADPDLSFLDGSGATLRPTHTASGNPSRFSTGTVTLRLDDEWRRRLPPRDRRAVAAATLPLRARYGFLDR